MPKKTFIISDSDNDHPVRPALSPDAREQQMIALAMDLVEKRLREGTATSQETTHLLKLATSREQLEKEKLELEKELLQAKTENIRSQERSEALFEEAIKAMKTYSGGHDDTEGDGR